MGDGTSDSWDPDHEGRGTAGERGISSETAEPSKRWKRGVALTHSLSTLPSACAPGTVPESSS